MPPLFDSGFKLRSMTLCWHRWTFIGKLCQPVSIALYERTLVLFHLSTLRMAFHKVPSGIHLQRRAIPCAHPLIVTVAPEIVAPVASNTVPDTEADSCAIIGNATNIAALASADFLNP